MSEFLHGAQGEPAKKPRRSSKPTPKRQPPECIGECLAGDIVQVAFGETWIQVTDSVADLMHKTSMMIRWRRDDGRWSEPFALPCHWRVVEVEKLAPFRRKRKPRGKRGTMR